MLSSEKKPISVCQVPCSQYSLPPQLRHECIGACPHLNLVKVLHLLRGGGRGGQCKRGRVHHAAMLVLGRAKAQVWRSQWATEAVRRARPLAGREAGAPDSVLGGRAEAAGRRPLLAWPRRDAESVAASLSARPSLTSCLALSLGLNTHSCRGVRWWWRQGSARWEGTEAHGADIPAAVALPGPEHARQHWAHCGPASCHTVGDNFRMRASSPLRPRRSIPASLPWTLPPAGPAASHTHYSQPAHLHLCLLQHLLLLPPPVLHLLRRAVQRLVRRQVLRPPPGGDELQRERERESVRVIGEKALGRAAQRVSLAAAAFLAPVHSPQPTALVCSTWEGSSCGRPASQAARQLASRRPPWTWGRWRAGRWAPQTSCGWRAWAAGTAG